MATRKSLISRPLDLFYFAFFLLHIPIVTLIDCQVIYPTWATPTSLQLILRGYMESSSDPFFAGGLGHIPGDFTWIKILVYLEAFFQLPVFVIGAIKLWRGSTSIYLLLLVYGVSTTTAFFPVMALVLQTPITSAETIAAGIHSITPAQRVKLLSNYIPFFLIPLMITVDMAFRVSYLIQNGAAKKKVV